MGRRGNQDGETGRGIGKGEMVVVGAGIGEGGMIGRGGWKSIRM